jgi:osmotically-inducible protein OsmY
MRNDSELKRNVEEELKWEPNVNEADIGVSARGGVVSLTGHVPTYAERHWAERAAKRVHGVRAVANELRVRLPGDIKRTDEEVARACLGALEAHTLVPGDQVKVVVSDGWVTLEGDVGWQYQKDAAESAIRYLRGVTGVSNDIQIKPHLSAADIRGQIEAAFRRSAEIDARRVGVEARGDTVVLRGTCARGLSTMRPSGRPGPPRACVWSTISSRSPRNLGRTMTWD